jgi:hypothetical protein
MFLSVIDIVNNLFCVEGDEDIHSCANYESHMTDFVKHHYFYEYNSRYNKSLEDLADKFNFRYFFLAEEECDTEFYLLEEGVIIKFIQTSKGYGGNFNCENKRELNLSEFVNLNNVEASLKDTDAYGLRIKGLNHRNVEVRFIYYNYTDNLSFGEIIATKDFNQDYNAAKKKAWWLSLNNSDIQLCKNDTECNSTLSLLKTYDNKSWYNTNSTEFNSMKDRVESIISQVKTTPTSTPTTKSTVTPDISTIIKYIIFGGGGILSFFYLVWRYVKERKEMKEDAVLLFSCLKNSVKRGKQEISKIIKEMQQRRRR